jgi:hypothetical protein
MIVKINGAQVAAAATTAPPEIQSVVPGPEDLLWGAVEAGRDKATEWTGDAALWILTELGKVLKEMGLWLLQIAPDASMLIAMILCLGAMASIPKAGKWTIGAVIFGVIMEAVRGSVFGI